MADSSLPKQPKPRGPGRPFEKGKSGNVKGRPPGTRCKATLAAQTLLDGEAEALTRKAVELALGGNMTALRLCLERIVPPRKDSPVRVTLPAIESATDIPAVTNALLEAVGKGQLTPSEVAALAALVEGHRKALETADLAERVAKLEEFKGL
ncbi:DUF5681 domain-containing protein [Solidesulfovibrio sp.]|uniref:DUF5681 domain-containing protein n=1 Tax=Solidesulfovibrio sp. TaxID=2910990 RepID=UPI002B21BE0C|nr:DUF5681 domain-containing protein [Solidesulfovibrio sp.]MEA4856110.1 DUF5681 domain-containing protein [Solidesulfovibrio sp.]